MAVFIGEKTASVLSGKWAKNPRNVGYLWTACNLTFCFLSFNIQKSRLLTQAYDSDNYIRSYTSSDLNTVGYFRQLMEERVQRNSGYIWVAPSNAEACFRCQNRERYSTVCASLMVVMVGSKMRAERPMDP